MTDHPTDAELIEFGNSGEWEFTEMGYWTSPRLDTDQRRRIAVHLHACTDCRKRVLHLMTTPDTRDAN